MLIPDLDLDFLPIPDPEVKKALDPDPQHCSLGTVKCCEVTVKCCEVTVKLKTYSIVFPLISCPRIRRAPGSIILT
jgi:hypothetical protein